MKKFGFTLAEVLITLGIIGVIAALTTPALVKNSGNAKVGPSLAKFVNTFETATENLFAGDTIHSYTNLANDMALLSGQMIMTPRNDSVYKFMSGSGTKHKIEATDVAIQSAHEWYSNAMANLRPGLARPIIPSDDEIRANTAGISIWNLKDGSVMAVVPATNDNITGQKGTYRGVIAEIIYDIDGDKDGNNKAGKDVYDFLLDRSGILIPVGSVAHKNIEQNGSRFATAFSDNCDTTSASLSENFACTGKIADNNYKSN